MTGGHLGVFVMGQTAVAWSNLLTRCDVRENEAMVFSGGDHVQLATVHDYGIIHRSVTPPYPSSTALRASHRHYKHRGKVFNH
jgi:hypothetical protein